MQRLARRMRQSLLRQLDKKMLQQEQLEDTESNGQTELSENGFDPQDEPAIGDDAACVLGIDNDLDVYFAEVAKKWLLRTKHYRCYQGLESPRKTKPLELATRTILKKSRLTMEFLLQ